MAALAALVFGGLPIGVDLIVCAAGITLAALSVSRPAWSERLHLAGLVLSAGALWMVRPGAWWVAGPILAAAAITAWLAARRMIRERDRAEEQRAEMASQLDRRISEIFSLQELSYVLSESIQLERIVEQVVRYASRFLRAEGAALILLEGEGPTARVRVAAALGTLEGSRNQAVPLSEGALVSRAIERDRIEVAQGGDEPGVTLLAGHTVHSAAVAPLRTHGVSLGALVVADRDEGPFTTEDLWLLSTVATHASVVLANSRLFEMVRRSTEEWETAFNALTEGIAVVDADGRISRYNQALSTLLADPEQPMLGAEFARALFDDQDSAHEATELIEQARRGDRPQPLVLRSEASGRILRLTGSPLRGEAEGTAVVVLVEDVTEQRAMEAQLIQNEKMAAIGQLVSGVAHELNNPLTSIAGLTELLLEQGPLAAGPRGHVRVIHEQAERAGRIVRNLLTFARKGTPAKEPVDLNDVVSRTALLVNYDLKLRGVELEARLAPEPVMVMGDRYELQQVLLNLTTNAVHVLAEQPTEQPRVILIETAHQGDLVVLRVRDTGPGVPPALVPYLFTPFFTTKAPGEGTGLGLSVSYGLVEAHGGRLSYQPAPDGGAEFTVLLPAWEQQSESAVVSEPAGTGPASEPGGARVLVVDPDPGVHRIVSALFGAEGHPVEPARSAGDALRMVRESDYELIIADATLRDEEGELVVSRLLRERPDWRARLVAAVEARTVRPGELTREPGLHWIEKPFNLRDLYGLAADLIGARSGGGSPDQ